MPPSINNSNFPRTRKWSTSSRVDLPVPLHYRIDVCDDISSNIHFCNVRSDLDLCNVIAPPTALTVAYVLLAIVGAQMFG
jgi:hypothetical protein